jgi:hypothetical protein
VGEIAVHLHQYVVAAAQPLDETVPVGRAQAQLASPHQNVDPAKVGASGLSDLGRAVGAGVVDDQDVGRRHGHPQPPKNFGDVVGFVVGRENDERPHFDASAHGCGRRYKLTTTAETPTRS